jgi:curved DNA-binding protein
LRLRGRGGVGSNGGANGDLYVTITIAPHQLFRLDGHDLYIDLPITPWEAALGATVEVPTLAGIVNLKIAPGTIAGQHLRLAKRGLPILSATSAAKNGDLFAIIKLVMPPELSAAESALVKQLADGSTFDPRAHFDKETSHVP